jgi:hypothetical protein
MSMDLVCKDIEFDKQTPSARSFYRPHLLFIRIHLYWQAPHENDVHVIYPSLHIQRFSLQFCCARQQAWMQGGITGPGCVVYHRLARRSYDRLLAADNLAIWVKGAD